VLLEQLTGEDAQLCKAIAEARLVLEVARTACALRERSGMSAGELDLYTGLPRETVAQLERGNGGAQAYAKLRRIARALDLDLRIVLVPRRQRGH
jgi:transcriptional regulator with XRE-family HTH domain